MDNLESADALPPGTVLGGKYTVSRRLGIGGMGAVYEAQNGWTGRRVAVKLLRPSLARNKEIVDRFLQEARAATSIPHPNIVEVLDVGEEAALRSFYIVQEFLDGMDLAQWTERRGAIPPAEAVAIITPVMSALVAVHAAGIVHRDIKPENVFLAVGRHGEMIPKLIDFGVSKVHGGNGLRGPTQTGLAIGTPEYMSPEQARGDADVDARSDVWSMGVMLYQLLTGRTPHDAATQTLLLVAIITEHPIPIERVVPSLPRALVEVVHRALRIDRAQRFQSMREFLDALAACPVGDDAHPDGLDAIPQATSLSLPVPANGPTIPAPPLEANATPMQWSAAPVAQAVPPRRSNAGVALVFGAFGVLAALGAGAMVFRPAPSRPAPVVRAAPAVAAPVAPAPQGPVTPDPAASADVAAAPEAVQEDAAAPAVEDAGVTVAEPEAVVEDAGAVATSAAPRGVHRRRRVRPRNNAPILAP